METEDKIDILCDTFLATGEDSTIGTICLFWIEMTYINGLQQKKKKRKEREEREKNKIKEQKSKMKFTTSTEKGWRIQLH